MRNRLVRLHLADEAGTERPSFEGILTGMPARNAGHYVLENCRLLTAADTGQAALEGKTFIPKERVLFLQELARSAT